MSDNQYLSSLRDRLSHVQLFSYGATISWLCRSFRNVAQSQSHLVTAAWCLANLYQEYDWPFSRNCLYLTVSASCQGSHKTTVLLHVRAHLGFACVLQSDWTHPPEDHAHLHQWAGLAGVCATIGWTSKRNIFSVGPTSAWALLYKNGASATLKRWPRSSTNSFRLKHSMSFLRAMLQQALKVSGRSASPLFKWMERCLEGIAVGCARQSDNQLRTLEEMPGPSVFSFAWDLFGKRGLSRLHELQVGLMFIVHRCQRSELRHRNFTHLSRICCQGMI